jgi:hypothetical protein
LIPIPKIVGTFGEETINDNGELLREFATYNNLKITNTFFEKRIYINIQGHHKGIDQ